MCVLYPSGTDFLTRMPTLIKEASVSGGSGGDIGDLTLCDEESALRLKYELSEVWFEGWICRLRMCCDEVAITICRARRRCVSQVRAM